CPARARPAKQGDHPGRFSVRRIACAPGIDPLEAIRSRAGISGSCALPPARAGTRTFRGFHSSRVHRPALPRMRQGATMTPWHTSPFTGLFTHFGPIPSRPHDPACALSSGVVASWLAQHEMATASGIGWDEASSEGACVGEAIERMQCSPLPDDGTTIARYDRWPLPEAAVDPATWVLFHADQHRQPGFPFQPLTRATECAWVCCRQAITGEPWWVPAELVYLHQPAGHRFAPGLSTGLACGRTADPILLRGLQEVIERDAVVGAWWGRYPLQEHPFSAVLTHLGDAARIVRPNLTYRCFRVLSPF